MNLYWHFHYSPLKLVVYEFLLIFPGISFEIGSCRCLPLTLRFWTPRSQTNGFPTHSKSSHTFIHSFIADIYIAPLQVGLLRSAPNPSAAECFRLLKEFLGDVRDPTLNQYIPLLLGGVLPRKKTGTDLKVS